MTLQQAELELLEVCEKLKPLHARKDQLERAIRKMRSEEFVRVNNIKRADVQASSGDDLEWFGTFYTFGEWLKKTASTKRFCEWNGRLYFTSGAMNGRMIDSPAYYDDVPT